MVVERVVLLLGPGRIHVCATYGIIDADRESGMFHRQSSRFTKTVTVVNGLVISTINKDSLPKCPNI